MAALVLVPRPVAVDQRSRFRRCPCALHPHDSRLAKRMEPCASRAPPHRACPSLSSCPFPRPPRFQMRFRLQRLVRAVNDRRPGKSGCLLGLDIPAARAIRLGDTTAANGTGPVPFPVSDRRSERSLAFLERLSAQLLRRRFLFAAHDKLRAGAGRHVPGSACWSDFLVVDGRLGKSRRGFSRRLATTTLGGELGSALRFSSSSAPSFFVTFFLSTMTSAPDLAGIPLVHS